MNNKVLALALIFVGLFLYGCGNSGENPEEISIDGSSTVYPITEAIAEEYRSEAPDTRVTIGVSGTGGGFQQFIRGEIDINNASREIQPSEIEKAKANNVNYVRLSVAYDGLAVVINPKNDWADYITVEELNKLWRPAAQNEITMWSQIREGWPEEEIHLYGPGVASGTYDYFTEVIVGESGLSRSDFTASEDDNVLVQGVATDKYALGFFGLAYYEENKNKLEILPVKDGQGEPVKPTVKTVSEGMYTPLSRPLFIYVSEQAAKKESVQEFVHFYLNNADKLVNQVGYVPMPDSLYQEQIEKFENFVDKVSSGSSASDTTATQN